MRWFPSGRALVWSSAASRQDPGHAEPCPRANSAAHNLPGSGRGQVYLRSLPVDEALGLLAGRGAPPYGLRWHEDYPMTETLDALALVVGAHQAEGWAGARIPRWWLHQIVVGDLVVGDASFHGPPQPVTGEVEIGYNVVEGLRGRGIASCACQLLLAQASADGASTVRADVDEANPHAATSRRLLLRAGFAPQGQGGFVAAVPGVRR